jgi:hypothetical protein
VALEVDEVAAVGLGGGVPEVHLAHVVEGGGALEAGDVPAQLRGLLVGPEDHGQGVPADEGADAVLDGPFAGMAVLPLGRDGVEVGGVGGVGDRRALPAALGDQLFEEEVGPVRPFELQHGVEGLDPLGGFGGIGVDGHAASSLSGRRTG